MNERRENSDCESHNASVREFAVRPGWRKWLLPVITAIALTGLATQNAKAESFLSRPITIVVPLPPGGAMDAIARMLQPKLEKALGQTVIVENRPGASGILGENYVAHAEPNGETLLIAPSTFTVNPAVQAKLPFDVQRNFAPIAILARNAMLLVVNPKLPVHNMKELVKLAKASPGKLFYSTPGAFSQAHLLMEVWSKRAGVRLQQVPFKGAAPAILSTLSGVTQITLMSPLAVLSQVKKGKLRALAVAGPAREPQLPDVPTTAEAGYPGLVVDQWIGMLTTGGTPAKVVKRLNTAVNAALKDKAIQEKLAERGVKTVGGTSAAFRALISKDVVMWKKIARRAKIRPK